MGAIGICSCFLPAFIYLRYVFRYEHLYQTNQIEHGLNCIEVLKQSFYLVYLIPQCFKKNKKNTETHSHCYQSRIRIWFSAAS